jgi:hypothetical protein
VQKGSAALPVLPPGGGQKGSWLEFAAALPSARSAALGARAAMLGAGPWLRSRPLRAFPVMIAGFAMQDLGRPGSRHSDLLQHRTRARELLLERRVGPFEFVAEVLVVVGGDCLGDVPQLSATAGTLSPAARRELMCPRRPAYGVASAI